MDVALSAAKWVVGKALAPVADGVLEAWGASKNLGLNIEALKMELLLVQATLETASRKEIGGPAMEELLQKLRDLAHTAEDVLDELDYFRIDDMLNSSRYLSLSVDPGQEDARERVSCCAWPRARQRSRGNSSSTPNTISQADDEVSGFIRKLGKLLHHTSSLPHVHADDKTPKLGFDRVDVSERIKYIVEELQPVRREVTTILQSCGPNTVRAISQSRPITTSQSIEPKLYGRDHIVNSIIHDITKGKYCGKDLSVLPIVGPGGIGKTTLIQHIYINQEVQNHFPVRIWVCVSLSFDLNKLLEEIKKYSPPIPEEKEGTTGELIAQRLRYKRFLLVLDDIWGCGNRDDWERLLLPLKTSLEKGSMVLVTTRFPGIAQMVRRTGHSIELRGLQSEDFRKLFHAFVFGHEQCGRDQNILLETGDMIIEQLKGSPLAAKTAGKLLSKDLSLHHWRRVFESKEWERQTGVDAIMPALKLSYDYLPFHHQQCFSYSALFPEDYKYSSSQLIDFWIGLNILQPNGRYQTFQDAGLSYLNDLVTHGFFREEETNGRPCYVMDDLLHNLALKVASHDCTSLHRSNVGSVEIHPSVRHLSIIIDDAGGDTDVSSENFKSELRELMARFKVEQLQTLMLFGEIDESFANFLGDVFREANALRVLCLPIMSCPVVSMLHNFSSLVHLRYLCIGTKYPSQMPLPLVISRFYHLRILDLKSWHDLRDLPKGMSNLTKLCHFYTPRDELYSDICNVGKLKLLEELKVFRVNKESEGFETKELEHLTELRELGIYNLEKIHTEEEASEAKLIEKNYLQRLTLDWDCKRSNTESDLEAVILERLEPHRYLQGLCIRGHRGPSCPTWLSHDQLVVKDLQSLHLSGVSWECLPSLGKMWALGEIILKHIAKMKEFVIEQNFCRLIRLELVGLESFETWVQAEDAHLFPRLQVLIIVDCPNLLELPFSNYIGEQDLNMDWLPKLQELEIDGCPEVLLVPHIPWTETLHRVNISGVKSLEKLIYLRSCNGVGLEIIGKDGLHSLEQVLAFSNLKEVEELRLEKCPRLELKHLLMLTSLKKMVAEGSDCLVGPLGGQGDMEWQLPVEHLVVQELSGASGKELTELVNHLPRLSKLEIIKCKNITQLCVEVDLQQTTSTASKSIAAASEMEETEAASEREDNGLLLIPVHLRDSLRELSIYRCPELVLDARKTGGLQTLRFLQRIQIEESPKFLSAYSVSSRLFPSFLQILDLDGVEGMGTLEPLSYLTSLTRLQLWNCGEDLRCEGLQPLLTIGGQLRALEVFGSPRFFAGWNPNARRVQLVSKLCKLRTDEATGLLATPICSLVSSSLIELTLGGIEEMERFSKKQEEALYCLASLQVLQFRRCNKLQHLPAGLYKLTNLKILSVIECPAVRSLPEDGLPKSLQKLDVCICGNEELIKQCRGLVVIIPEVILE